MTDRLPPLDRPFSLLLATRYVEAGCQGKSDNCPIAGMLRDAFPGICGVFVGANDAEMHWLTGPDSGVHAVYHHDGAPFVEGFDAGTITPENYVPRAVHFTRFIHRPMSPEEVRWRIDAEGIRARALALIGRREEAA